MANLRFMLLLCMAVLLGHVPLTGARHPESRDVVHRTHLDEGEEGGEKEGEGEGKEGEEGEGGGEEEEEGKSKAGNVSTSFTLIGSFTFLISLQFFMHHPDADMKEYAYTVISSTVSIFSAVLMFQSLNGLVETFIIDSELVENNGWLEFVVNFIHMSFWYLTTQIVIAKVTKAFEPDEWRDKVLEEKHAREAVQKEVKIERICWGIIFAHLTGFASINFWSSLQLVHPFNQSWYWALVPIPIAAVGQLGLQTLTDYFRESYAGSDGKKDWFEEKWDESCEEAEDDILGLTISVLVVSACRFGINSAHGFRCLPNEEQKEEGKVCEELDDYRTEGQRFGQIIELYLLGLLFVFMLFISKYLFAKYLPEEDKAMEDEENEMEGEMKDESNESRTLLEERLERISEVWLITLSMSFSWCIFHGTHQLLRALWPSYLGKEANSTTLAVILALSVTYLAFLIIRGLDMIADLDEQYTPPAVDEAIRTVIRAMALFIGFAWEQTFDQSVDSLADNFEGPFGKDAPAIAKFLIGTLCIGIVFFAWKYYILPIVVQEAWKVGYTEGREGLEASLTYLAENDKETKHVYQVLLADLERQKSTANLSLGSTSSKSLDLPAGGEYQRLAGDKLELLENENEELRKRNTDLHKALQAAEKNLKDLEKTAELLKESALSSQKTQEMLKKS